MSGPFYARRTGTAVGTTDPDALHKDVGQEINAIAEKASPVNADLLVVEDSEDSFKKKKVPISALPAANPTLSKSISVESPTTADDITMFFTPVAITITQMRIAIIGSSTPSWTVNIRHSTDRTSAGNALIAVPAASNEADNNAETTGHTITSFDDPTIPANSFVWLETDAVGGTLSQGHVTIRYTVD